MDCDDALSESRSTASDEDEPWWPDTTQPRGHTDRPLPPGLLGQNHEVTAYFRSRRDATTTSTPIKHSFSANSPHSCRGCRHIVITAALLRSEEQVCLSPGLLPAIHKAQQGCAFFAWLVDLLIEPTLAPPENDLFLGMRYADIAFHLAPEFELESFPPRAMVVADFIKPSGDFATGMLIHPDFGMWTDEEDPAAAYVLGRPVDVNKGSVQTMEFIRNALQRCRSKHAKCRCAEDEDGPDTIRPSDLPARLLRITQGGHSVRLIRLDGLPEAERLEVARRGYASLSYCWGGPQPLQLTPDTFEMLTLGFEASLLPKTLADAAYVTASVGLSYLWVDALCIIQTDDLDKATEISRMALYYGACTVTISAASAAACQEGFLGRGSEFAFEQDPFAMAFATPEGGRGTVKVFFGTDTIPREPIATRGWTFQETMLSRRVILFDSNHASWCCNTGVASSGGTLTQLRGHGYDVFAPGTDLESKRNTRSIQAEWRTLVEEFTQRNLGLESDKLLAIAALAERMGSGEREKSPALRYVAGIFLDPKSVESWARELLWVVHCQTSRRSTVYRAPSWSWAALDGWLFYPGDPFSLREDLAEDGFCFKVLDLDVQLSYSHLPFGSVRSARCLVSGLFKPLWGRLEAAVDLPSFWDEKVEDWETPKLELFCDTVADRSIVEAALRGTPSPDQVFLLELVPPYLPLTHTKPAAGLVLLDRAGKGIMSRIGAWVLSLRDTVAGRRAMRAFYDDMAERCEVPLI